MRRFTILLVFFSSLAFSKEEVLKYDFETTWAAIEMIMPKFDVDQDEFVASIQLKALKKNISKLKIIVALDETQIIQPDPYSNLSTD